MDGCSKLSCFPIVKPILLIYGIQQELNTVLVSGGCFNWDSARIPEVAKENTPRLYEVVELEPDLRSRVVFIALVGSYD